MLTRLSIENFKGIGDRVDVPLAPITLLFGANSAGKSSVIHAVHYAREVFGRHNLDADITESGGKTLDLGGFQNFVHAQQLDRETRICVERTVDNADQTYFSLPQHESNFDNRDKLFSILRTVTRLHAVASVRWSDKENHPVVQNYQAGIDGAEFARIHYPGDGSFVGRLEELNIEHPSFVTSAEVWKGRTKPKSSFSWFDTAVPVSTLAATYQHALETECFKKPLDPEEFVLFLDKDALAASDAGLRFRRYDAKAKGADAREAELACDLLFATISHVMQGVADLTRESLNGIAYIGPIRETPNRRITSRRSPSADRWATGLAAWDVLMNSSQSFVEEVSKWLDETERLNTGYRIERNDTRQVGAADFQLISALTEKLKVSGDDAGELADEIQTILGGAEESRKLELVQTSDSGQIRLQPHDVGVGISQLIPVVVAAMTPNQSLTMIEQPELHLHPALQVRLAELFIERANSEKGPVLLETHSEHMLLRFLRRIRETRDDELPPGHKGLRSEQLSVLFVEPGPNGVEVKPMSFDDSGTFVGPKGFFDERAKELF